MKPTKPSVICLLFRELLVCLKLLESLLPFHSWVKAVCNWFPFFYSQEPHPQHTWKTPPEGAGWSYAEREHIKDWTNLTEVQLEIHGLPSAPLLKMLNSITRKPRVWWAWLLSQTGNNSEPHMEEAEGVRGRREKRKKMKKKRACPRKLEGRGKAAGRGCRQHCPPARPPGAQRPLPSRPSPPAPAANTTPTRAPQRAAVARWHI